MGPTWPKSGRILVKFGRCGSDLAPWTSDPPLPSPLCDPLERAAGVLPPHTPKGHGPRSSSDDGCAAWHPQQHRFSSKSGVRETPHRGRCPLPTPCVRSSAGVPLSGPTAHPHFLSSRGSLCASRAILQCEEQATYNGMHMWLLHELACRPLISTYQLMARRAREIAAVQTRDLAHSRSRYWSDGLREKAAASERCQ